MSFTLGNLGMSFGVNQDVLRRMASQQAGQPAFPATAPMSISAQPAVSNVKSVSPSARASTPVNPSAGPSFNVSTSPAKQAQQASDAAEEEEIDELASDSEVPAVVAPTSNLQVPNPNNAAIPLPILPSSSQTPRDVPTSGRRSLTPSNIQTCGACGALGHRANSKTCPKYKDHQPTCGECGQKGHRASNTACPKYADRARRKSQGPLDASTSTLPTNQSPPNGRSFSAPQSQGQPDQVQQQVDPGVNTAPASSPPAPSSTGANAIEDPASTYAQRLATPPLPEGQLAEDEHLAISDVLYGLLDAQTEDDRMVLHCFANLPSPDEHAGYYDKVVCPRSLRTVQRAHAERRYTSQSQMYQDLRIISTNATQVFRKDSNGSNAASHLLDKLNNLWDAQFPFLQPTTDFVDVTVSPEVVGEMDIVQAYYLQEGMSAPLPGFVFRQAPQVQPPVVESAVASPPIAPALVEEDQDAPSQDSQAASCAIPSAMTQTPAITTSQATQQPKRESSPVSIPQLPPMSTAKPKPVVYDLTDLPDTPPPTPPPSEIQLTQKEVSPSTEQAVQSSREAESSNMMQIDSRQSPAPRSPVREVSMQPKSPERPESSNLFPPQAAAQSPAQLPEFPDLSPTDQSALHLSTPQPDVVHQPIMNPSPAHEQPNSPVQTAPYQSPLRQRAQFDHDAHPSSTRSSSPFDVNTLLDQAYSAPEKRKASVALAEPRTKEPLAQPIGQDLDTRTEEDVSMNQEQRLEGQEERPPVSEAAKQSSPTALVQDPERPRITSQAESPAIEAVTREQVKHVQVTQPTTISPPLATDLSTGSSPSKADPLAEAQQPVPVTTVSASQLPSLRAPSVALPVESGAEADAEMSDAPFMRRSQEKGKSVDRSDMAQSPPKKRFKPTPSKRSSANHGDAFFSPNGSAARASTSKPKSMSPVADKSPVPGPSNSTGPAQASREASSSDSDIEIISRPAPFSTMPVPPVVAPQRQDSFDGPPRGPRLLQRIYTTQQESQSDSPEFQQEEMLVDSPMEQSAASRMPSPELLPSPTKSDTERPKKKRKVGDSGRPVGRLGLPPGRRQTPPGGYEYEEPQFMGPPGKAPTIEVKICKDKHGPNFIKILRSDGGRENWPDCDDDELPDRSGQVDFWRACSSRQDESKAWLRTIGMELADFWDLSQKKDRQEWVLESWPQGYRLFEHHKGPQRRPMIELYLYGSNFAHSFTNPRRALDHFNMLVKNDLAPCPCESCRARAGAVSVIVPPVPDGVKKASESHIMKSVVAASLKPHFIATSAYTYTVQEGFQRTEKMGPPKEAARRRAEEQAKLRLRGRAIEYKGPYINREREDDLLRAVTTSFVRHGEMVWVRINPLVSTAKRDDGLPLAEISYWPGIVVDRRLMSKTRMKSGSLPSIGCAPPEEAYSTDQWLDWQIALFGIDERIWRSNSEMLPWLAHTAPYSLKRIAFTERSFNEIYNQKERKIKRASLRHLAKNDVELGVSAYGLALQISGHVFRGWNFFDRYITREDSGDQEKEVQSYQGVYLGGERIWVGDMVRLIALSTEDKQRDIPLPDPLPRRTDVDVSMGDDVDVGRSLLLKINSIYRHSKTDHPRVSGSIYELYDAKKFAPIPEEATEQEGERFMPAPPPGHKFRLLTAFDCEHHIDLIQVAGRYYQADLLHPMASDPNAEHAPDMLDEDNNMMLSLHTDVERCMCLAGLPPVDFLHTMFSHWARDRQRAVVLAEKAAAKEALRMHQGPTSSGSDDAE